MLPRVVPGGVAVHAASGERSALCAGVELQPQTTSQGGQPQPHPRPAPLVNSGQRGQRPGGQSGQPDPLEGSARKRSVISFHTHTQTPPLLSL